METILILIILIVGFGIIIFILNKKLGSNDSKSSQDLLDVIKILQNSSSEDRRVLLSSLQENSKSLNERLDAAARVIGEVNKNIGEMSEIGRGMKDLQDFLRSPKLRGNMGEHVLKELLSQMLPKNSFTLQYAFKSGEKVDAAIKTSGGIVPIDSKFPLENFQKMAKAENDLDKKVYERAFEKDVKVHIDAISKKYILPAEGTIDYALMYIPSEAIYYEIVNNLNLFDYAGSRRVLAVSPTTFYAYIRAILMSFEGQKIEARAREILVSLRAIQKDYTKVEENLGVLQKHLTNASNIMTSVFSSFSMLGQKIDSTKELGVDVKEEAKQIE